MLARPVKPQPTCKEFSLLDASGSIVGTQPDIGRWEYRHVRWMGKIDFLTRQCPFGSPGHTLWLKEKWALECPYGPPEGCDSPDHVWPWHGEPARDSFTVPWRPAITMPRWASKRALHVLNVRVGRVQSITWDEAVSCGSGHELSHYGGDDDPWPVGGFINSWDTVYGKRGWGLPWGINPWAWLVEFKVL